MRSDLRSSGLLPPKDAMECACWARVTLPCPTLRAVNSDKPRRASGTWLFEGIKNVVGASIMAVQQSERRPDMCANAFAMTVRHFYCWRLGEPIPTGSVQIDGHPIVVDFGF